MRSMSFLLCGVVVALFFIVTIIFISVRVLGACIVEMGLEVQCLWIQRVEWVVLALMCF